jgi:hypothetical protein
VSDTPIVSLRKLKAAIEAYRKITTLPHLCLLIGIAYWAFWLNGIMWVAERLGWELPSPLKVVREPYRIEYFFTFLLLLAPLAAAWRPWRVRTLRQKITIATAILEAVERHRPAPPEDNASVAVKKAYDKAQQKFFEANAAAKDVLTACANVLRES